MCSGKAVIQLLVMKVLCRTGSGEYFKPVALDVDLGSKVLPEDGVVPISDFPACLGCRFVTGSEVKFVQLETRKGRDPTVLKCHLSEALTKVS